MKELAYYCLAKQNDSIKEINIEQCWQNYATQHTKREYTLTHNNIKTNFFKRSSRFRLVRKIVKRIRSNTKHNSTTQTIGDPEVL